MHAEHTYYKDSDGTVWQVDGYGFFIGDKENTGQEPGTREVFLYTKDIEGPLRIRFAPDEWSRDKPLDMSAKGLTAID